MRGLILSLLTVAALAATADASNYSPGYTYDGYTLSTDGYWYNHTGKPFLLVEWTEREYSKSRCCWYDQRYYHWKAAPVQQAKLTYEKNWRVPFVQLLRDKAEADAFERSMEAAGLQYDRYGGNYHASQEIRLYGASGSTAYGYAQPVQQPSLLNTNVAFQQASRLVDNTQRLQAEGLSGLMQAIQSGNGGQLEIEKIRAAGQVAVEMIKAQQPQAIIKNKASAPATMPRIEGRGPLPLRQPALSVKDRVRIIEEHLLSQDPDKHMPKGGATLTDVEIVDFMSGKYEQIDQKYSCTACHQKQGVKFVLR